MVEVSGDTVDHLQGCVLLTVLDFADATPTDLKVFSHLILADTKLGAVLIHIVTVD